MMSPAVWAQIQRAFTVMGQLHGNFLRVEPQFRFKVIVDDPDDNKFCDCAIAVAADYVVTEDRHFLALAGSGYRPKPISALEFSRMLLP